MKKIRFKLTGRRAELLDAYWQDELRDLLSFHPPGYYFSPAYKHYLRSKAAYERGEVSEITGWNGTISMLKRGAIPVGLLLGAKKEIRAGGFKPKIIAWKKRPNVPTKKGFKEKDPIYHFQNEACYHMLQSLSKGGGVVLAATGSGKTKTCAQFFSWVGVPCVFVVDQVNLLYQAQKEIGNWLKERVGIVGHGKFSPARITVATIQTLWVHRKNPKFRKWARQVKVQVIDELHKQMGRRNFQIVNAMKPDAVIGLTATLQMKKKEVRWKVYSVAGPVIYEFPAQKGIAAGVLAKGSIIQLEFPDQKEINTLHYAHHHAFNDYAQQVIYHPAIEAKIQTLVAEAIKQKHAVVILCERIKHLKFYQNKLAQHNLEVVHGQVPEPERQKIIKRFEAGKVDVIIASTVFTKGVNIKRISLIIDLAQRKSPNDALQKLGRGLRLHQQKDFLRYIDVATVPSFRAAATRRRNTFKKAGFPVTVLSGKSSAKEILSACEKQISKDLKKRAS